MKKQIDVGIDKTIDFLFISILFLIIFFINLPLANSQLLTPDASGYLDMGRNLFSGKGAVISYNLNQYWLKRYHPFLPYTHPIYPVIAGIIWSMFHSLKAVIGFNILLLSLNCALLYKIIRVNATCSTSFFIVLFMGFSQNFIFTSIFPWTEQLHIFLLLLAIFIYLSYRNAHFLVGIILAMSCLARFASFYNVLAFCIAIIILRGFSNQAIKEYTKTALGFLIIFLTYEMLCYLRYGVFYPEYLTASKLYRSAEIYSGAFYKEGIPTLNTPQLILGMEAILSNLRNNLHGFINIFGNIKFVYILVPLYIIYDLFKRKNPLLIIFFFQGICVILGYSFSHFWAPVYEFARFSVIAYIMLGTIGFLSLKEIINQLTIERRLPIVFAIFIAVVLYFETLNYLSFRIHFRSVLPQELAGYRENRDEMYEWIKTNTEIDALIASDYFQVLRDAFLLERPFVSLPPGRALTAKNMNDFLKIYKPDYILTHSGDDLIKYLMDRGFKEIRESVPLVLLGRD